MTTTATPLSSTAARIAISRIRGAISGVLTEFAVDAAFAEQLLRMRLLEVLRADLGARDVRGDRQHRYAAALRVEQAVDQVQVARSAAACAHRQLSGQRGVGRRGETRPSPRDGRAPK